jgi:hypothetical protein
VPALPARVVTMRRAWVGRMALACAVVALGLAALGGYAVGRARADRALATARRAAAVDSLALVRTRTELARRDTAAARAETLLVVRRVATDRWLARVDSVPALAPLVTAVHAERLAADAVVRELRGVQATCDSLLGTEGDRTRRAIAAAVLATQDTLRAERRARRVAQVGQWVAWGVAAAVAVVAR